MTARRLSSTDFHIPGHALWIGLAVLLLPTIAAADLARSVRFNIAPQALSSALVEYSQQSGVQVTSPAELVEDKQTSGVVGLVQAGHALEQLLAGTDLG